MAIEHLGYAAAELLSLSNAGGVRSLSRLGEMATSQVPGCSAANTVIWHDGGDGGDEVTVTATHPDTARLADLQLESGDGPVIAALRGGRPVRCPDMLDETRWPGYADAALRLGVRCSVHLIRELPSAALVLSLYGVRPRVLDIDANPMADTLAAFGRAMLANATVYGEAQLIATQFKDAVAARSVVDQAKGILMHAIGCDADDALRRLRKESQRRHIKVTEVASQVVDAYGGEKPRPL